MSRQTTSLDELFEQEEAAALAAQRDEIAKEDAAWAELSDDEKRRISAEREARLASMFDPESDSDEDEDEQP